MRRCWDKAKRVEDILRIIPNINPWVIRDRFGSIQIGKVPAEFGDDKKYEAFLEKICNSKVMQRYRQFKLLEQNLGELAKVYPDVKKVD